MRAAMISRTHASINQKQASCLFLRAVCVMCICMLHVYMYTSVCTFSIYKKKERSRFGITAPSNLFHARVVHISRSTLRQLIIYII